MTAGAAGEASTRQVAAESLPALSLLAAVCVADPGRRRVGRRPGDRGGGRHRLQLLELQLQRRQRHRRQVPAEVHLGPARERRPRGGAAAGRHPVRERRACRASDSSYDPTWGRVKSITRPAAGNHEYKTAERGGLLRLLQRHRAVATGPGRRPHEGLLQLQRRHLAPDRAQLDRPLHDRVVRGRLGAGDLAEGRPRREPELLHAGVLAPPALQLGPRRQRGRDGSRSSRRSTTPTRTWCSAATPTTTSASRRRTRAAQLDNARGIRQFVVGTGGAFFTSVGTPKPNSQVRQNTTYGVLKLTLHPTSYDWQFVPEAGKTFTDSGTGQCHGGTPPADRHDEADRSPGNLRATAGTARSRCNWNASTDNVGVTGYRVFRGGTQVGTPRRGDLVHGHGPRARQLQLHGAGRSTRRATSPTRATPPARPCPTPRSRRRRAT